MRNSLLDIASDPASLRKHQAPTVTSDGRYYPAITTLLALSTPQVGGVSESGDFDIRSILRELAGFYDYLLFVTASTTAPTVIETVAGNCARAVLLISNDAVGREGESAAALPLTSGLEAFTLPYSVFIAHVPE